MKGNAQVRPGCDHLGVPGGSCAGVVLVSAAIVPDHRPEGVEILSACRVGFLIDAKVSARLGERGVNPPGPPGARSPAPDRTERGGG
jgi:hypothetical protein